MAKILIIEDDRAISDIERDYLELSGFETDVAYDGVDGLSKALSGGFDLILLDLMLPGLDGLSLCSRVRADPELADVRIIILTAKSEDSDVVRGLELGADDYVTKPFSREVLLARIHAVLRRISHAANGFDVRGPVAELLAEAHELDIDGTFGDGLLLVLD